MKSIVKQLFKIAVSGVAAFAVLCGFCLFYYNPPVSAPQATKYTNSRYVPNKYWCSMKEGFGYGRIDAEGYNNPDYDSKTADIIVLGSSYTEATQVSYDRNYVSLLSRMLKEDFKPDNDFTVLNKGVSGQNFYYCVRNIGYVPQSFDELKYIIVETAGIPDSPEGLKSVLEGEYTISGGRGGIYGILNKFPYLRLLYAKLSEARAEETEKTKKEAVTEDEDYVEAIDMVMKKIYNVAQSCNAKPIIMYHCTLGINESGEAVRKDNEFYYNTFAKACEDNNIKLINVTDDFMSLYETENKFTYGFANSLPGKGHLNENGHRIIAENIYEAISELEEN